MADDVLSAAELETLLQSRASGVVPGCSSARPSSTPAQTQSAAARLLCPDLKRVVSAFGDLWARESGAELAALLRRAVRLELAAVSQVTYREFTAQLANPTFFNWLSAAPLEGPWMLEVSPTILYPMIDCMLGGGHAPRSIATRPPTDIELRLAGRVTRLLARQLQTAWRPVVELQLDVERVASRPDATAMVDSGDAIVWIRLAGELEGARGTLNLGIPRRSLTPVTDKLTRPSQVGQRVAEAEPAGVTPSQESEGAAVELVACLAQSKIAPDDARDLAVGDVIATDQQVGAPIAVFEDGVLRFRARAGALAGRKALVIEDLAAESQDSPPDNGTPPLQAGVD